MLNGPELHVYDSAGPGKLAALWEPLWNPTGAYAFLTLRSELPTPYPNINAIAFLHLWLHPSASCQLVILGKAIGMSLGTSKWNVIAAGGTSNTHKKRFKGINQNWGETIRKDVSLNSTLKQPGAKQLPHNHQTAADNSNCTVGVIPRTKLGLKGNTLTRDGARFPVWHPTGSCNSLSLAFRAGWLRS